MKKLGYKRLGMLARNILTVGVLTIPSLAFAGNCGVIEGPTPIMEGAAKAANDLTLYNDKVAISFAIGTNNYWNMTRGSVLDIGIRDKNGGFGHDLTNDAEFLLDLWTATGSYKGENLLTGIESKYKIADNKESAEVEVKSRFWVADADKNGIDDDKEYGEKQKPLNVITTYTLKEGCNYVTMKTIVDNPKDNKVTYKNMYSGYSISTLAASMFGPFGFYPDVKTTGISIGRQKDVQEAFGEFVVTYGKDYAISTQLDDADSYKGSSGYKDVYKLRDLKPGSNEIYNGELLISDRSETASVIERYIDRHGVKDVAQLTGTIKDVNGKPIENAYVILEKKGVYQQTAKSAGYTAGFVSGKVVSNWQPLAWFATDVNGNYSFTLPKTGWDDSTENIEGNSDYIYRLKIEAAGYTGIETDDIVLTENLKKDLTLNPGAKILLKAIDENGQSIPFKVKIEGLKSEMKTLGGSVYFSDAHAQDSHSIAFDMPKAEKITFTATQGAGFCSLPDKFTTSITNSGINHTFKIPKLVVPEKENWYAMDNHNHSDFGDGSTTIQDLYSIQVAEGMDFSVVTDHDTRLHNAEMADFSKKNKRIFLSNIEISPGWGHWGALNVAYGISDKDKAPFVDPSVITPSELIRAAHKKGATVIMHHPYSDYGFLNNQASVKGGNDKGWQDFDLLELQNTMNLSEMVSLKSKDWELINLELLNQTMPKQVKNMDAKTLVSAMAFWNKGIKKYLSAGSDAHDAHSDKLYSGVVRLYAFMEKYDKNVYLNALKNGKAYVTTGPLMFPKENAIFGNVVKADSLNIDFMAVNGLDKVYMFNNGVCVDERDLQGTSDRVTLNFNLKDSNKGSWYNFLAVDKKGNWAVSNPIWR